MLPTYRVSTSAGFQTDGVTGFIFGGAAVVNATPLTMMVDCFIFNSVTNSQCLICQQVGAATGGWFVNVNTSQLARAQTTNTSGVSTPSGGIPVAQQQRNCIVGVWRSATHRQCWVNGRSDAADTTSVNPGTPNNFSLGCLFNQSSAQLFAKAIFYRAAVWNIPLEAADIQALAKGVDFRSVQPGALKDGWYIGDGSNLRGVNGTQTLVIQGTITSSPQQIILPPVPFVPEDDAIALAGTAFRRTLSRMGARKNSRQVHIG